MTVKLVDQLTDLLDTLAGVSGKLLGLHMSLPCKLGDTKDERQISRTVSV